MTRSAVTALIERQGVVAVEAAFIEIGWLFREQPLLDYGIDAHVEIVEAGNPVGRLIALQIKSGVSYFARKHEFGYRYYGSLEHLDYWLSHSLPVFLVLHNPEDGRLLWQRIDRHLVARSEQGWSIDVPEGNVLDKASAWNFANAISNDEESTRRHSFVLWSDLMKRIRDGTDVFICFDIWVNKSLSFRGASIYFETVEKNAADLDVPVWGTYDHDSMLQLLFPWAQFKYEEEIEECAGEIESHVLRMTLNEFGSMYLAMEDMYAGRVELPGIAHLEGADDSSDWGWGSDDQI